MEIVNKVICDFAYTLAKQIGARALLINNEVVLDTDLEHVHENFCETILITRKKIEEITTLPFTVIDVPDVEFTRLSQVKIAIIKGIAGGLFHNGDKLVCLTGIPRFGHIDSVFIVDVGMEFEILTSGDITDVFEGISPEVFDTVLNIALELAAQGREGRQVGTIFVIGDHEKVLQLSQQMIINPFKGYSEEERNVLDHKLKETIKELSAIDGAFIVKETGPIVTAGRHLNAAVDSKDFPKGLGSRHIAAAGITSLTKAIAIVISESTGTVRVFKKGKIFVEIEKA